MAHRDLLEQCVVDLHRIGVVKFGNFTLKSGMQSPIYFDLRMIISYPKIMETVAELMWAKRPNPDYDLVCGVAYTGLPIATVISTKQELPMLIRRKESKGYGTKKLVEGNYEEGQTCLMIEDVIVSGSSVYETLETLKELKLKVDDAVVFLDREQGGAANLTSMGVKVISVVTMTQMMAILLKHGCINQATSESVLEFIESHNDTSIVTKQKSSCKNGIDVMDRKKRSFESRTSVTNHPLARKLFEIMSAKKTNLCVAADVTTSKELISLAEKVGPHICLLKTHIDILTDFNKETVESLKELAATHNFMLFEDRKFGDIGSTVASQYSGGTYNIVDWAEIVTVHGLPGDGIIKGLMSAINGRPRGCVLVSEMSSAGALTSQEYISGCCKMAENHTYFVIGFVSQSNVSSDPRFILLTPGVQLDKSVDGLGQQYVTPRAAVLERGADIVIVGRGIREAEDPEAAAIKYKEEAFSAYLERIEAQ
ncbi:uridine 5'-monophosphate synthase-like [Penaeus japonicus]|uniref:uridine 5'-monophosphate synthase-like n=1 Tax=Penaeus japonicus TaxID=27405 RepID=UPI001C7120D6|nr:uridine 5'-monophosphate synthase-like [Penaeus japonicus]XP_042866662.1 uridine 5'-monophosphate synthase-like [Penaeus japonicus]